MTTEYAIRGGVLTVLIVRDSGLWIARFLQHDIVAQGESLAEAVNALMDVFYSQISIDLREGREPLCGIGPAPRLYWDLAGSAS